MTTTMINSFIAYYTEPCTKLQLETCDFIFLSEKSQQILNLTVLSHSPDRDNSLLTSAM